MWNKLFKSKSKSSKNLSSTSSSNGSTSTTPLASPPLDMVPIYNHETDINFRRNNNNKDEHNRDSIGAQMCGIPMRKSKFSNAFKSLSLRRGSTKNQLKLYPGAGDIPVGDDEIHISTVSKRDSLRPSKSDNNLNEKQNYADQEKDDVVYSEQYIQQPVVDPFLIIPEPPENLELQQCPICTRNFVPTSLAKHIGICEKMQSKKRKPFDSSRQRREGTELASYLPKNFGLPQNHPQARVSPPKTTNPVRKLSTSKTPTPQRKDYGDNGINHLMSSSLTLASTTTPTGTGPNAAMASSSCTTTPRPILKRSLSQQNEPCPYCERCFGFKAFDRHVEWCREKALLTKNANNNNSISAAKERLQARIQYKAPQIKSKRALNREKYSGSLSCGGSTNSLADLDLPLPRHRSHLNSMSSSISSDNGFTPDRYDPFISAKRQLEELFSASSGYNASTPRQQQNNSRSTTPLTPTANCMSKSVVTPTTKTSPVVNSNFRRASSLRMPRKVSRPMFIEKAKSNIQKGITDDGPVSPNFLKSSEYDEIPIKSAFNALQMAEKPKMRDSSTTRKNLKLDIKDPNMPATDVPLSKTDSLAVFLKYEHELNLAAMSEKDMKDKSNSLSKRSLSLGGQERKESMLYGGVTGNGLKNDRSPQDEKDKAEKILQNIQPFKKLPQKLIPIKLEPINITYSNNNSSQKTINNVNNSSKSNNITKNNNNNINSSNIGTSKPAVISLDAILGKKPKPPPPPPPQEEKENRKDPNYIDPKLINKCDNLPIVATKLSSSESECSASTIELSKKPTDSNRLAESSNSSPENSGGETGGVDGGVQQPILDKKLTNDSTNDDSYDTRPTLTRQNGTATCSSSSSRDSSREESPVEQQLRSPLARNQSHLDDTKPQTPDSGLERTTPKPSTPIPVQKKPERPPLPSFDDFDFDEFISSFEDERRSFKNALYARSTNSNCITSSSNSTSFIQHTNSSVLDNSVKSVTSLNGSVSSTSSPSHVNSSNSPHYNSINTNGRSDETQTTTHQPKEPPQVPRRRHIGELNHTPSHSTIRNLPSLQGSSVTKPAAPTPTDPRSPKATHAFGPTNDNINNNSSPLPRDTPSSSRLGSGNSFNHHHQPYQHHHQQQQHQPSTANHTNSNNNNNTISAHLVPQPYTATVTNAGSPLFDYHGISRHQSPLSNANNGSNGSGIGGPASGGGGGGIIFDDLSPTERDLMKSVQELDRMCESSSSMYPADSDEMSSVEGYPLSNSPRDHGSARHHHHRSDRPSAEGSKFSADSAYGSLSRQSPPEQHHTIRRAYGHHRGGSKSTNATSQQDTFDNSSGSESSLPPITATLKTQKVELHAHKVTPAALAGAKNAASLQMSKFCHECGSRFMIDTAKFCMECGIRRIMLD
ncbi:probable serine/threonine-protein kinase DDB_G0282963 isoform X5 [Ochlerotatus camptorhynchus]|uniref:probable serine/threonine-protein kinase DDB_G0282963 isoform X5 n=1 Tax=Ochlerotatus camptorhynchus TaxID=644619 RepID=UPI0031D07E09